MAPMAAKVPPTWSAIHQPERVGVPPNDTGRAGAVDEAHEHWAVGSRSPGLSFRGPHWPRWPTQQVDRAAG